MYAVRIGPPQATGDRKDNRWQKRQRLACNYIGNISVHLSSLKVVSYLGYYYSTCKLAWREPTINCGRCVGVPVDSLFSLWTYANKRRPIAKQISFKQPDFDPHFWNSPGTAKSDLLKKTVMVENQDDDEVWLGWFKGEIYHYNNNKTGQ